MKILFVEDDYQLGDASSTFLKQEGHIVEWVTDGAKAIHALQFEIIDLVLLDLGLPKESGFDVLKFIKHKKLDCLVMILTATEEVENKIIALDLGADDYVTKPYNLDELSARIRALTRRKNQQIDTSLSFGNVKLDPASRKVFVREEEIKLSRREYALLQRLIESQGKAISKEILTQVLYNWDQEIDSNTIEVHIYHLRKKFSGELNIRTIRGIGYILEKI
tara:strand:+ start:5293 stop:5955 length:663 start_codon:yes stop_codon:yes gene_type:complete